MSTTTGKKAGHGVIDPKEAAVGALATAK